MALVIHEPLPHIPASKICKTGNPRVLALGGGGNAPGIVAAMVTYVQELLKSGHDVVGLFGSWPALKNSDVSQMPMIDFKNIPAQQLRALIAEG
ncbi:hypothetical protein H6768_05365 [Candidatus Peribacteria bacterium]|nr:hypothetical protein [Candidatus Peribacteria bacterium]